VVDDDDDESFESSAANERMHGREERDKGTCQPQTRSVIIVSDQSVSNTGSDSL
jgi:hypothetical protein